MPEVFAPIKYKRLVDFLKQAEGGSEYQSKKGSYRNNKYWVYSDIGHPAIGYGHRATPDELKSGVFRKGVNEKEATELLRNDIAIAEGRAKRSFGKKGWKAMDDHRREMAIEFAFNLGNKAFTEFPKFAKALRNNNWEGIAQEYERFSEGKPLEARNQMFYSTYIEPMLGE
jgi:GH24 family phage-related lysozyme (muramidase)